MAPSRRYGRLGAALLVVIAALGAVTASPTNASASTTIQAGFNNDAANTNPTWTAADIGRAESDIVPGGIFRFPVTWIEAQPDCFGVLGNRIHNATRSQCHTPAPADFSGIDGRLTGLAHYVALGEIKLLPDLTSAPAWAWGVLESPDPTISNPVMPPGDDSWALTYWGQFVAALMTNLKNNFPGPSGQTGMAGLEVWNEENLSGMWSVTSPTQKTAAPDPPRYTHVLCNAFNYNYGVDARVPVVFGGLASPGSANWTDQTYGSGAGGTYLKNAYLSKNSGGSDITKCMNAIGIHPYNVLKPTQQSPEQWFTPDNASYQFKTGPELFGQIACQTGGECGRPIWITEFGYPIIPPSGLTPIDRTTQGSWEQESYKLAAATNPSTWPDASVTVLLTHTLFDYYNGSGFGVCGPPPPNSLPGTPFTVYPAANDLKRQFSGNPGATATC